MLFSRCLLAVLVAAGLVGCASSGILPHASPSAAHATTDPAAVTGGPAEPKTAAGARAAAAHFYSLYFAGSFVASWDLLTPVAKRQISQSVWVKVHSACPSAVNGKARVIKSVILFGDTAIITERQAGVRPRRSKAEDVFKYTNGHWGYVPGIPGVYHRGSVAADIAAAKASGLCATRKAAPL